MGFVGRHIISVNPTASHDPARLAVAQVVEGPTSRARKRNGSIRVGFRREGFVPEQGRSHLPATPARPATACVAELPA